MIRYLMILALMAVPGILLLLLRKRNGSAAERAALFAACAVLFFFMAFRSEQVGADTKQYTAAFEQLRSMSLPEALTGTVYGASGRHPVSLEYGYRLYNWLLGRFFSHPQAVTAANSAVTVFLLYRLISRQSRCMLLSVWLYITLGLFQTEMNMARNAIAILWSLCAVVYTEEKKPWRFAANILAASLFHQSVLFFLVLYPLVRCAPVDGKRLKYLLPAAMAAGFGIFSVRPLLPLVVPERYQKYLYVSSPDTEGMLLGAFYLVLILGVLLLLKRENRAAALKGVPAWNWLFVLSVFFFCVSYTLPAAARAAALFSPCFIVYIPRLLERGVRSESRRKFALAAVTAVCGAVYVLRLTVNNIGGTMPYTFFWQ